MTNPDNVGGLPLLQFAVFDEFGKGADDRVWDYGRLCFEAGRELCRAAPAGVDMPPEDHRHEAVIDAELLGAGFLVDGKRVAPERVEMIRRSAPAGSGEAGGWLLDGCLIYRLSDGRNQTNTHEINVTMWGGSRELAVRDKAAAALLRKLQQGAE